MTYDSNTNRGNHGRPSGNRGGYGKPAGKDGFGGNKGGFKGNRGGKPYGNGEGGYKGNRNDDRRGGQGGRSFDRNGKPGYQRDFKRDGEGRGYNRDNEGRFDRNGKPNFGKKPYGDRSFNRGDKPGYKKDDRRDNRNEGYQGADNSRSFDRDSKPGYKRDFKRDGEGRFDRGDKPGYGKKPYGNGGGGYRGERSDDRRGGQGGRSFDRNGKPGYGKKPYGQRDGEGRFDKRDGDNRGHKRDGEGRGYNKGGKPGYGRDGYRSGGPRKFDGNHGGKPYADHKDADFKKRSFTEERAAESVEAAEAAAEASAEAAVDAAENNSANPAVNADQTPQTEERRFERHGGEDRGPRRDSRDGDRGHRGDFGAKGARGGKGRGRFEVKLTPGRAAACEIGRVVRERNAFTSEVTPGVLAKFEGISPEDAAFATKIARGVTATLGTVDEFINRNLRSPDDIEANVRDAMRVSAYELLYLNKASYAAVDQGVELVRSIEPKAAGLANSVLRKMADNARAFPFGNPHLSLQVLARSEAFPLWIAKRLMNEMGLQQATAFMHACNADAPVYAAVNAIKATDAEIEEAFDQAGSLLETNPDVPGCFLVKDARVLRKPEILTLFEQGKVCISDASAQAIALLACPEEAPENMLEIGCGRGTKTILINSDAQRKYGHTLAMTSVDDHDFKTNLVAKRAKVYGIETVSTLTANAAHISEALEPASFDAVFVDAPCSGVGTLRRHPEIRWRLTAEDVTAVASVASDLLFEAAQMVKPGGTLTYATCTVFAEENEELVGRFLRTKFGESFTKEAEVSTTLTATGPDAHYAVRLRRAK